MLYFLEDLNFFLFLLPLSTNNNCRAAKFKLQFTLLILKNSFVPKIQ